MHRNTDSNPSPVSHREKSGNPALSGWFKARLRDVMIAAQVLHDVQFVAPWLDGQSPASQCNRAD